MSGVRFGSRIVIRAIAGGDVRHANRLSPTAAAGEITGEIAETAVSAALSAQGRRPMPERGRLMAGRLGFIAFKPGKMAARRRRARGRVAAGSASLWRQEFESGAAAPLSFPPTGKERAPSH